MSTAGERADGLVTRTVNVVASTRVSRRIDLDLVARSLPDTSYDPEHFAGLVYRRRKPKATLIMFAGGKMVSTGAASEKEALEALHLTLEDLRGVEGRPARIGEVSIVNVVAVADLGHPVDLPKVLLALPGSSYEPEMFPALTWTGGNQASVLVFQTGGLVCAGAKSEREADDILRNFHRRLLDLELRREAGTE